jgi:cell division cycle 14
MIQHLSPPPPLFLSSLLNGLQGRLYYNAYYCQPSLGLSATNGSPIRFFSIDDTLLYWNFFRDFGPLNLGQLYRFCMKLNGKLGITPRSMSSVKSILSTIQNNNFVVCYYSSIDPEKRANAIFLICAWQVLFLDLTPEETFYRFRSHTSAFKQAASPYVNNELNSLPPIPPFHDASPGICTFELTVLDVLRGLAKARTYCFFQDFKTGSFNIGLSLLMFARSHIQKFTLYSYTYQSLFLTIYSFYTADEYEHYELVENGDLNWIIDGQFLAFAGPQDRHEISQEGFVTLTPMMYIKYFEKKHVGLVVRLNKKCYDENVFKQRGINHVEHYYLDGSCPSEKILSDVISSFEKCIFESANSRWTGKAVAVHCKAGLGRTGTCIGAYMMKHYKFTAAEAIGWMRLCRPGCVIGPQQHFLQDIEQKMWHEGDVARLKVHRSLGDTNKKGSVSMPSLKESSDLCVAAVDDASKAVSKPNTARIKQRKSHRVKASGNAYRTNIVVNAFQSIAGFGSCEPNITSVDVVERERQGEALRAAHGKRLHL